MSPPPKLNAKPSRVTRPDLAVFAATLARGITEKFDHADRLELVSYLVTWAVAEAATRQQWTTLRPWLNEVLAPAIASGLDVGFGFPGHGCKVDALPPGGEGVL